ncbi:MAG: hypothetical protein PUJ62_11725 [Lachnospiraceae bacterium]|nr:hypothetical protein [Lachnospiraceae bacterium]
MKIRFGKSELFLTEQGMISDITFSGESVFPTGEQSFLIRAFRNNLPETIEKVTACGNLLTWQFRDTDQEIKLSFTEKEDYTVFEVVECPEIFDYLAIGPVLTTLKDVVGDVVGVVQGGKAAIGIQALNIKTLPGFPYETEKSVLYKRTEPTSVLTVSSLDYSAMAAYEMPFGSVLQLFGENRRRDRIKTVLNVKECVPAPAMNSADADIAGCKFALFSCDREKALETIGKVELGEGLPHPMVDGEWLKTSRKAMNSYLICEFGTENIDKMLAYTKKGGFPYLYHSEPFDTWGHFEMRQDLFPQGDASLKECIDKAEAQGIHVGLHTLSTFTKTNDPYVTPVPDHRLKAMLPVKLTCDVTEEQEEMTIDQMGGFVYPATLNCFRIGDELLQYASCETKEDNTVLLKGCVRGAFGTRASSHLAGSEVYYLIDYPYMTLFPDIELQDEFADRIAQLFNETGVRQLSFDGLEGCEWTGEGEYADNRFCMRCYEQFDHTVLNDASRLHHFLWHMNTRMNWGEPWGEEMRTGQVEGRLRNQAFFKKNLFPPMLGWFLIRKANRKFEASTLMDVEWALSEAAGFDAGFSFTAKEEVLDSLGNTKELLETIKNWEILRYENRFKEELKEELKKPETEWHLEKLDEDHFELYPMAISKPYVCDLLEMQPGQPGGSDWSFTNKFEEQELVFRMKVDGYGYVENIRFYNQSGMIKFQATVKGGQYLLFDGKNAFVTDRNYNVLESVSFIGSCRLAKGTAPLSFGCTFGGEEGPEVKVRVMTKGDPQPICRNSTV